MPSSYPSSVDTFNTKVDGVTDVLADHVNKLQSAVVNVQAEIGLTARGNKASLSERLDVALNSNGTLATGAIDAIPDGSLDGAAITDDTVTNAKIDSLAYSKLTGVPAAFTPATHASTHASGGGDEVALAAAQITSGTVATARLGSSTPTAAKFLRGDQTWNQVAYADVTGTPSSVTPTAHAASHGSAGSDPVSLNGNQITAGTVAPARLGSGSTTSATFLHGDSTWAALAAADIPSLDAAKITTGTVATARLPAADTSTVGVVQLEADGGTTAGRAVTGDDHRLKRGALLALCAGFTPTATGGDVAEIVVPYDPNDGTTSVTWNVRRIDFRVNVAGGAPAARVEKSTASTAFSASTVGTATMGSGDYEVAVTSSLGTVASGNKLRLNVITLATATGWTVEVLLGES